MNESKESISTDIDASTSREISNIHQVTDVELQTIFPMGAMDQDENDSDEKEDEDDDDFPQSNVPRKGKEKAKWGSEEVITFYKLIQRITSDITYII